ncbi:MAG: archease [Chloroflexi bacterium]|nr:archease [Chloroflexota bacterium]
MALNGYKEVEHTADIALQVWARDFPSLLKQAAEGLYALMDAVLETAQSKTHQNFTIPHGNHETVVVDFLTELLFFVEEKGLALSDFSFENGQNEISVQSTGRRILTWERDIKAVTFHDLNLERTATGFSITITFDV